MPETGDYKKIEVNSHLGQTQTNIGLNAAVKSMFNTWPTKPVTSDGHLSIIAVAFGILIGSSCDLGMQPEMRAGINKRGKWLPSSLYPNVA